MSDLVENYSDGAAIVYEDENVIVINKPAGIAMHRINSSDDSITVHELFEAKLAKNDPLRGGIVHRLDKDTSGVLVLAKNIDALNFLQQQFKARTVKKTYLALVWGHPEHSRARIELPLARSSKSPTAMKVSPNGKLSVSEYNVISEPGPYSYVEVTLETGRTHQIRVQFAHMGHPVVGDKMYGHKPLPGGLKRQFLHAHKLSLVIPGKQSRSSFEAPLADDLKSFLESIGG